MGYIHVGSGNELRGLFFQHLNHTAVINYCALALESIWRVPNIVYMIVISYKSGACRVILNHDENRKRKKENYIKKKRKQERTAPISIATMRTTVKFT